MSGNNLDSDFPMSDPPTTVSEQPSILPPPISPPPISPPPISPPPLDVKFEKKITEVTLQQSKYSLYGTIVILTVIGCALTFSSLKNLFNKMQEGYDNVPSSVPATVSDVAKADDTESYGKILFKLFLGCLLLTGSFFLYKNRENIDVLAFFIPPNRF